MVASVMKDRNRRVMVLFHYTADGQYDWQRVVSEGLPGMWLGPFTLHNALYFRRVRKD